MIYEHNIGTMVPEVGCKEGKNYIYDIGIRTLLKDIAKHIAMVHDLFYILAAYGLHLKLSKSIFLQL
jgi:hypothetical protein